ncbi:uncharacterized protein LOC126326215 [Schistocerca gregaria]|uniref:uncharacterized protein LOC126326215 n=1 Tax=Schistocerca gregaria TaxID=7010 RepID=UPI00211EFC84|nr:uncharacterized protein LOC126326215 [Schistocerca gregaria]
MPSSFHIQRGIIDIVQYYIFPEYGQLDFQDYPELEFALPLSDVLIKFEKYLEKNFTSKNKSFALVTDGPNDFYFLRSYQNKLWSSRPDFWNRYFDLRAEFCKKYNFVPETLFKMIEFFHLPITDMKSSFEECTVLAAVVNKLLQNGHTFFNLETVKRLNSYYYEWALSPNTVRIIGISWDTTKENLEEFMFGLEIENSVICYNISGCPMGNALIWFASSEDATAALSRSGNYMENLPITVKPAAVGEFERVLARQKAIRRLVFGHVLSNFLALKLKAESSIHTTNEDNEQQDMSFSQRWSALTQATDSNQNMTNNDSSHRHNVPRSCHNLFQVSENNSATSVTPSHGRQSKHALACKNTRLSFCKKFPDSVVSLQGLPYSINAEDILKFFEEYDVIADSLTLLVSENNRPSGEAYIAFTSPEEANRAIQEKNKNYIHNRYLDLVILKP